MDYEWDERKRRANLAKHGVDFAEALHLEWGTSVTGTDDRIDYGEVRFRTAAMIGERLHILVWTPGRQADCRIISLRKANSREVRGYVEQL